MSKSFFATLPFLLSFFAGFARDKDVPVPFADPFIYVEKGMYYLYGTSSPKGIGVVVSRNLRDWWVPGGGTEHLALDKDDSFGDKGFWAPEVYKVGDRYLMYYTAQEHVSVAEAESPLGPFRQKEKRPILDGRCIDNSMLIDADGKPHLYWVRVNEGNKIWTAELEDDFMTVKNGTDRFCIEADSPWEKIRGNVTEGPFVLYHDGLYYLTYSGNDYRSQDYAIGYATADNPSGPWTKYSGNPVLRRPGKLFGTGHHSFFTDSRGRTMIVYHSHFSDEKVHPRLVHIGRYRFNRKGELLVSKKYITLRMVNLQD